MGIIDFRPGDSFMHKCDPRVKVLILLVMSIIVFVCENLFVVTAMALIFLAQWFICKLPMKDIKGFLKVVTGMMGFIIVLQIIFYGDPDTAMWIYRFPEETPVIGGMGFKWDGLFFGILLAIRFYALIMLLPTIVKTTRLDLLSLGIQGLGMNYKIAYMATTALNMIPAFQDEIRTIQEAQKMRGQTVFESGGLGEKIKGWISLVVPLVVGAMRRAQMMGVAMDTRAFGAYPQRTCISTLTLKKSDVLIGVAYLVLAVALLVGNFTLPNLF